MLYKQHRRCIVNLKKRTISPAWYHQPATACSSIYYKRTRSPCCFSLERQLSTISHHSAEVSGNFFAERKITGRPKTIGGDNRPQRGLGSHASTVNGRRTAGARGWPPYQVPHRRSPPNYPSRWRRTNAWRSVAHVYLAGPPPFTAPVLREGRWWMRVARRPGQVHCQRHATSARGTSWRTSSIGAATSYRPLDFKWSPRLTRHNADYPPAHSLSPTRLPDICDTVHKKITFLWLLER